MLVGRFTQRFRGEGGASIAELALVAGLLLLLAAGVADLGRAFHTYMVITNASREGARWASRYPDDASGIRQAAIQEAAISGITLAESDVDITGLGAAFGAHIEVGVTYRFSTILSSYVGAGTITMRGRTEMRVYGVTRGGG